MRQVAGYLPSNFPSSFEDNATDISNEDLKVSIEDLRVKIAMAARCKALQIHH